MKEHFCNCPVVKCQYHPSNHEDGCDPCMKSNLAKKEMPTCMFRAVHDDVSEVKNYSIKGFVNYCLKYQNEYHI